MRGQIETLLELGIEAANAGERERAEHFLTRVIELDQYNEQAWLWLSSVVQNRADKVVCLENVLVVNPDNADASVGLQYLRQQPTDSTAVPSLLPRLAAPGVSDEEEWWSEDEEGEWDWEWEWEEAEAEVIIDEDEGEWGAPPADVSPAPVATARVCPGCGFRNPGWAYVCDRCGTHLQQVDVRQAVGPASEPRGRSFLTVLQAWGGAITFSRLYAFLPEIELASWGRSLAAVTLALLLVAVWRAATTLAMRLAVGEYESQSSLVTTALDSTTETLLPVSLLFLVHAFIAPLTWAGARLVGGRQKFTTHVHLTTVAFSAWVVLVGLLAPLLRFGPHLLSDENQLRLFSQLAPPVFVAITGVAGFTSLTQAVQVAHSLSAPRAILVTLLVTALGAALLFGLDILPPEISGWLRGFFAPLPGPAASSSITFPPTI